MKQARPETAASANAFLRDRGVDQLPADHPLRRKALADWGKWYARQPTPDAFKNMAERDPNRKAAPPGWARPDGQRSTQFEPKTGAQERREDKVQTVHTARKAHWSSMHDLFMNLERMQSPFATDEELEKSVQYWLNLQKKQAGEDENPETEP